MHQYNVVALFERIAKYIAGTLSKAKTVNRYLLIIIEYFTKWLEVISIHIQEDKR